MCVVYSFIFNMRYDSEVINYPEQKTAFVSIKCLFCLHCKIDCIHLFLCPESKGGKIEVNENRKSTGVCSVNGI